MKDIINPIKPKKHNRPIYSKDVLDMLREKENDEHILKDDERDDFINEDSICDKHVDGA